MPRESERIDARRCKIISLLAHILCWCGAEQTKADGQAVPQSPRRAAPAKGLQESAAELDEPLLTSANQEPRSSTDQSPRRAAPAKGHKESAVLDDPLLTGAKRESRSSAVCDPPCVHALC